MAETELSVVCKSCGSEVSPYVTECPVLRHPASQAGPEAGAPRRRAGRRGEPARSPPSRAPGAQGAQAATRRPVAHRRAPLRDDRPRSSARPRSWSSRGPPSFRSRTWGSSWARRASPTDWWHYLAAPFVYDDLGYLFAIGLAMALFVPGLERRLGIGPDRAPPGRLRARSARSRRRGSTSAFGDGFTLAGRRQRHRPRRGGRLVHAPPRRRARGPDGGVRLDSGRRRGLRAPRSCRWSNDFANPWAGIVGGLVGLAAGFSATLGRR